MQQAEHAREECRRFRLVASLRRSCGRASRSCRVSFDRHSALPGAGRVSRAAIDARERSAREDRGGLARQDGVEHAALAEAAADADGAALGLDDAAGEDEAEAAARGSAGAGSGAGAELLDLDEEALDLLGG